MKPSGCCVIEGCERPRDSRGMCKSHWNRWRRHGDPLAGNRPPIGGSCTIDGCDRPHLARGWCSMHWSRWQRNGDPLLAKPRTHTLRGPANAHWLSDEQVTYHTMHDRVKSERGSASAYECVDCGKPAAHWSYDNADPDERAGVYRGREAIFSLKVEHYQPRCARCHKRLDVRVRAAMCLNGDGSSRPLRATQTAEKAELVPVLVPEPQEAL